MSKRSRFYYGFVAIGLALMVTIGWTLVRSHNEPVYNGQPESYWVRNLARAGATGVQSLNLGSNQVPVLLKAVTRHDDRFQQNYKRVWSKLPGIVSSRLPPPTDPARIRTNAALILAAIADSQTLAKVFKASPDPLVRLHIVSGLGFRYDQDSTRALIDALNDMDSGVRANAALGLSATERDKEPSAIPGLISCLEDKDKKVRFFALGALSAYVNDGETVAAEVEKVLKTLEPAKSNAIVDALQNIDSAEFPK